MRIPFVPRPVTDVPPPAEVVQEAQPSSQPVDVALRLLTRSADHGRIWMGAAAVGAVVGGSYRRAGMRGLGSLAMASFVSNSLVKPLVGRRRPDLERTSLARRIGERPWTSSFPSGHSASAAAFATGAALELPVAGLVLAPVAAAVAYSRVHVGVHYKSDVLVGAGVGVVSAFLVRKLWAVREHGPAKSLRADLPRLADGAGLTIVINRASGSAQDAGEEIGELLPKAVIFQWDPEDGPEKLHTIIGPKVKALGVAGGDGTCASVAGIALDNDLPLAVFAAGTFNHFAKALGLAKFADTAECVRTGSGGAVDVARIDGVPFLNTASIGLYPDFVAERDRLSGRLGKPLAAAIALPRVFAKAEPVVLSLNGKKDRVWTVFVGNGHYIPRGLVSSSRDHMADGQIDVQVILDRGKFSRTRAVIGSLTGQVERSGVYASMHTKTLAVEMETEDLRVAHDGEVTEPRGSALLDLDARHLRVYRSWR
ncbi:MAG: phosphatase PAP2 family protein [Nakamurella sp.]